MVKTKGGTEQPPYISVGKEYTYIRSNFEQVTDEEIGEHWEWDEEIIQTQRYVEMLAHQDDLDAMAQIIISLMEEQP